MCEIEEWVKKKGGGGGARNNPTATRMREEGSGAEMPWETMERPW